MLGLQVSGRIDLIQNMVDNFAYLIDQSVISPMETALIILEGRSLLSLPAW